MAITVTATKAKEKEKEKVQKEKGKGTMQTQKQKRLGERQGAPGEPFRRQRKRERKRKVKRKRERRKDEQLESIERRQEQRRQRRSLWQRQKRLQRRLARDDMAVAFLKACVGFTAADFMWLMDGVKMRHHIYIYNPKDKTTRHPDNEVPWPALFVLSRFHKNFRLQPTKRPKMEDIKEAMVEFSNRMKWKAYFANDDDAKHEVQAKEMSKIHFTPTT